MYVCCGDRRRARPQPGTIWSANSLNAWNRLHALVPPELAIQVIRSSMKALAAMRDPKGDGLPAEAGKTTARITADEYASESLFSQRYLLRTRR
jgi:hypothetical protein